MNSKWLIHNILKNENSLIRLVSWQNFHRSIDTICDMHKPQKIFYNVKWSKNLKIFSLLLTSNVTYFLLNFDVFENLKLPIFLPNIYKHRPMDSAYVILVILFDSMNKKSADSSEDISQITKILFHTAI